MLIENVELLKAWLAKTLEPLCEADPATLAKYVFALVKKDRPEEDVKQQCLRELRVFLNNGTDEFVERLFITLHDRSYLTSAQKPTIASGGSPVSLNTQNIDTTDFRLADSQQGIKVPNEFNRAPRDQRPSSGYKFKVQPRSESNERRSGAAPYSRRSKSPRVDHGDRYHRSPVRHSSNTSVAAHKLVSLATHRGLARQHSAESAQSTSPRRDERRVPALHGSEGPSNDGEGYRASGTADSRMYQSTERLGPPGRYTSRNVSPDARDYERSSHRHDDYEPQREGHSRSRYADERYSPPLYQRRHRHSSRSRTRSRTRSRSPTRSSTGRASTRYSPGAMSRCSSISYRRRSRTPPVLLQQQIERGRSGGRRNGSISGEEGGSVSPARSHSSDSTSTSLSSEMPNTSLRERRRHRKKRNSSSAQEDDLLYGECLRIRSKNRTVPQPAAVLKQRCQDYEERGYCIRAHTCPYDHGTDPVVFSEPILTSVMGLPDAVSSQFTPASLQGRNDQLPMLSSILPNLSQPPPPIGCHSATLLPPPHYLTNPPPLLAGQHQGVTVMMQHHMQAAHNPSNLTASPYKPGEGRAVSPYQPSVSQSYATPIRQQPLPALITGSASNNDLYVPQPVNAVSASSMPEPYNPQPYIPRSSSSSGVGSISGTSMSADSMSHQQTKLSHADLQELGRESSSSQLHASLQRASTYQPTPSGLFTVSFLLSDIPDIIMI